MSPRPCAPAAPCWWRTGRWRWWPGARSPPGPRERRSAPRPPPPPP
ncbi:serine/threonine protein kinase, partial [Streptomyces sp. NPDC059783]